MGLSAGVVSWENHRLLVSVTVISLLFSPFWLEASRRLHRVVLLGITSGSETIRLTFGPEARAFRRTTARAEHQMIDLASNATRWVGDIMPRRGRDRHGPDSGAAE